MRYIVGIDFGTHQTKVCIEETFSNGQQLYEFLEFPFAPNNVNPLLFPSIVQINQDDTISYGFVDTTKAKYMRKTGMLQPQKEIVSEPIYLELPSEPKYKKLPTNPIQKYTGYLATLAKLRPKSFEEKLWVIECIAIKRENEQLRNSWREAIAEINRKNQELKKQWEQKCKESEEAYQKALEEFKKESQRCYPLRFRYFKQATFIDKTIWNTKLLTPEQASILYLAYIRFILNEKIGKDYICRMGVPCSYSYIEKFKQIAYNLWFCAGEIVEHYKTLNIFLKTSYLDLLDNCKYKDFKIDNETALFDVRTEAQAGLFAVVANKRIETRINLLFDIGGGTTDIAAFYISPDDNNLHIMDTISVPIGLNFIFEKYKANHPKLSIESVQQLYTKDTESFSQYIQVYTKEIKQHAKRLSDAIKSAISQRQPGFNNILLQLQGNPSVYCGGGARNTKICNISIQYRTDNIGNVLQVFADKRVIDGNLLGINKNQLVNHNINNDTFLFLATAYGLSLSDNWLEQPSENIINTFNNSQNQRPNVTTTTLERNDDD